MIVWAAGWLFLECRGIYSPALPEGLHTFAVRAYDAALNVVPLQQLSTGLLTPFRRLLH